MSDYNTLLDEALGAWKTSRDLTVAEFQNIPAEELDRRPAPGVRTVGELVVHIIDAGRALAGEVVRADGDLTRKPPDDLYAEYATGAKPSDGQAALVGLLRSSMADIEQQLRSVGADFVLGTMPNVFGQPATRFASLHFAVEHESYHRGQLTVYARTLGHVPALTQMLHGSGS